MAKPDASKSKEPCWLLKTPLEIQMKVLRYACQHSEAIKPEQWIPGSSKFSFDLDNTAANTGYYPMLIKHNDSFPAALMAFELTATCKAIHSTI